MAPVDTLKRSLKDLRISVTDRCNFRCNYCMPHDEYARMARDCFDTTPDMLTPEAVLDRIRETDTCTDLRSPVEVWIDSHGFHTVRVHDSRDD